MAHFHTSLVFVSKAAKPRKVPRTYARVRALSNTMAKAVKVDFVKGITTFKKKVSPEALMEAYKTRSYGALMATIPWQELPDHLEPVTDKIGEALVQGGQRTIDLLPAPIRDGLRWDIKNPRITKFINERTGKLIVDIQQDTMDVVHNAVQRSFTSAWTPRDVADEIKNSIGLHERYANAVINYQNKLLGSGMDPNRADQMVDSYYDRLLDSRAMTVAKTEVRQATSYGQLSVWKQGANEGFLPPTAKKVWVTCKECVTKTPSPCDLCLPMDGAEVELDGFWTLADGSVVEIPSDAHPNCNCGMTMSFGEQQGSEDQEEED